MQMIGWVRRGGRVWLMGAALSLLGSGAIAEQARAVGGYGPRIVVGSGFHRPWGVGVDSKGDVFVADTDNKRLVEVSPDGTQATIAAPVKYPTDVAVDAAGDVFASDFHGTSALEVMPNGTSRLIGSGLLDPYGIAVDGSGDVFVADSSHGEVDEIKPDGAQTTVASGFLHPTGVAVDSAGDVLVADATASRIVEIRPDGSESVIGVGLIEPWDIAVGPNDDLFVSYSYGLVAEITPDGIVPNIAEHLRSSEGLAVDSAGDVFVADTSASKVLEFKPTPPDPTSTSVSCGPEAAAGTPQICTATVADTLTPSNTPTGTVRFTRSGHGTFGHSGACTLSGGTCAIKFTTKVVGQQTITATYRGAKAFAGSTGQATLTADPKG